MKCHSPTQCNEKLIFLEALSGVFFAKRDLSAAVLLPQFIFIKNTYRGVALSGPSCGCSPLLYLLWLRHQLFFFSVVFISVVSFVLCEF